MGSVTILSSLGAGHYSVRINFDNARVDQRIAAIQAELAEFSSKLAELQTKKVPLDEALHAAKTALNDYTAVATVYDLLSNPSVMNGLVEQVFKAQVAVELQAKEIDILKLKKISLEKEKDYLQKNCPSTIDATAWCVEYKENLSGTIESIEVDYLLERDNITDQIRNDTGVWLPGTPRAPTAKLQHVLATSSFAAWFNLCMAPAMQRHKPMYRIAILSNLDKPANTCDLDFIGRYDVDKYQSKIIGDKPLLPNFQQGAGLPAGQQMHYTGANIIYGSCNAKAFINGDKVIVDLHKGVGLPTVIGFYENPRQCIGWNTTAWGFYDTTAQPSGLGIPPAFNGLGPISHATFTKSGSSLSGTETDLVYTQTSATTTLPSGVTLQYIWTFKRNSTVYDETNVLHTNVLHEEININLVINGVLYGSVYSYLRELSLTTTYTPRSGAPWILDPHQSVTRSATAVAKQLQVGSNGSVSAVRNYTGDEDYLNNRVLYSRATTGVAEAPIEGVVGAYLYGFLATINDPTYAGQVNEVTDYNVYLYQPAWRLR